MNVIKKRHRAPTMYGVWVTFLRRFFVRRGRYLLYKMHVFLDEILYLSKFIK